MALLVYRGRMRAGVNIRNSTRDGETFIPYDGDPVEVDDAIAATYAAQHPDDFFVVNPTPKAGKAKTPKAEEAD